jgi:hypothetical protein
VSAVTYTILSGAVTTPVFPGVYEFGQPHVERDSMRIPLKSLECEVRHGVIKVDL